MLIGGLLKVIVQRPGWVRSMLNCEGSGMAYLLSRLADQLCVQADLGGHGSLQIGDLDRTEYLRPSRRFTSIICSSRHELLTAVNIIRCTGERCVAHNMNG